MSATRTKAFLLISIACLSLSSAVIGSAAEIQKRRFSLDLSGGVSLINIKDLNDCIRYRHNTATEPAEYVNWREVHVGGNILVEVIYYFSESLGIGVGTGSVFFHNSGDYGFSDRSFFRFEKWNFNAVPVSANLHLAVPLSGRLKLRVSAGAAYYFSSLTGSKGYQATAGGTTQRSEYNVDAASNAFGLNAGLGIDIKIWRNVSLIVGGNYRLVKFKDIKGTKTQDGSSLDDCYLWHAEYEDAGHVQYHDSAFQPEPTDNPPWVWRHAEYDLSGITLKAGLKYLF